MKTLRSNNLWKKATNITDHMYGLADEMSVNVPDEKWNTERKIRSSATDMMFHLSQAIASITETSQYDWNNARKNLFGLQTMYIFACQQHFLESEPELVVKIDKLMIELEKGIEDSKKDAKQHARKEMEPWLEKYRLWKEMQADNSK